MAERNESLPSQTEEIDGVYFEAEPDDFHGNDLALTVWTRTNSTQSGRTIQFHAKHIDGLMKLLQAVKDSAWYETAKEGGYPSG